MAQLSRPASEFDRFLYSSLVDQNGTFVTVLSALVRQGIDPWEEAARLTQLPREDAVNSLSSTIWKVCSDFWSASEASIAATRLVQLLPAKGSLRAVSSPPEIGEERVLMWIIYGVVWCTIVLSGYNNRQVDPGASAPPANVHVADQVTPAKHGSQK